MATDRACASCAQQLEALAELRATNDKIDGGGWHSQLGIALQGSVRAGSPLLVLHRRQEQHDNPQSSRGSAAGGCCTSPDKGWNVEPVSIVLPVWHMGG